VVLKNQVSSLLNPIRTSIFQIDKQIIPSTGAINMNRLLPYIILVVGLLLVNVAAQGTSNSQQIQSAEDQLTQVYQKLVGILSSENKKQLKESEIKWIRQKEAAIVASSNPDETHYQVVMQRVAALQGVLQQVKGQEAVEKSKNQGAGGAVAARSSSLVEYNKVEPIYQEVNWDNTNVVAESLGSKYRAVSIARSNKIYVFDVKTKLLYGTIEFSDGEEHEADPASFICFAGNGSYIYGQKPCRRGMACQFSLVPSLLTAYRGGSYNEDFDGPVLDNRQNVGVIVSKDYEQHETCYFTCGGPYPDPRQDPRCAEFLKNYPEMSSKIGYFGYHSLNSRSTSVSNLVLDREGICKTKKKTSAENEFSTNEEDVDNCLGAEFSDNLILLNNETSGEKSTFAIDVDNLTLTKGIWSGPTIINNPLLKELQRKLEKRNLLSFSSSDYHVNPQEGSIEGVKYYSFQKPDSSLLMTLQGPNDSHPISIPKNSTERNAKGNTNYNTLQAYYYKKPLNITVGFWELPGKFSASYRIGIYNNKTEQWVAVQENDRLNRSWSQIQIPSHFWDSQKGQMWLSSSNSISQIDLTTGKPIISYDVGKKFEVFALSDKRIFGMPRMDEKRGELWNREPLKKVCDLVWSDDGNIMLYNDTGFYAAKSKSFKSIAAKSGDRVYPFEQFDLKLNRPDIIFEQLGFPKDQIDLLKTAESKRLKRMGITEEMLKPDFHLPELQIKGDIPATTAKDRLDLPIKATDDKYPLDRLRVYVNNVPVNGRDGELLRDQKTQSLEKTIPIKLAAGRNKIQVSVLNSAGAESLYANAEVNCTVDRPKPTLYAVSLGVSHYDRPEWCLKYAAKDATDLIGKIKEKAGSTYSEVMPLLLTDKDVTKESAAKIKQFLSGATIDDTVVIFMAGHGILDDKYDYYFGTSDIDPAKPSERGMPYEAIDNILAEVPSLKKALLMDTCHAGELDQDEKKELAASDGNAAPVTIDSSLKGKVAMRSIGTRGMTVKAIEGAKGKSDWYEKLQDMFVDLRRGSGATVISSSQGAEYAFESSQQSNGLFTYALMEALDGKATPNKDGQITINSVGDYVKKRVQDLTKGKQNPNLRGVNLEEDFILSSTK
jgi:hypothetical protein